MVDKEFLHAVIHVDGKCSPRNLVMVTGTLAMMSRFGCSTLSRSFLEEHANRFKAFGELLALFGAKHK